MTSSQDKRLLRRAELVRRLTELAPRNRIDAMMEEVDGRALVRSLPFEVNLAPVQNVFYQLLQNVYPAVALEGDESSQRWVSEFAGLGEKLGVCVEPVAIPAT